MLTFADFVPVSARDGEKLQPQILASGVKSCEFSFANLVMWVKSFDIRYAHYNGHLYLAELDDDIKERGLLFLPCPDNEPDPAELRKVSDALHNDGIAGKYFCVDAAYFDRHRDWERFFSASPMEDAADEYIYETEKLASLAGEKLSKKRNLIAQFLRENPDVQTCEIDATLARDCIAMAKEWQSEHPDKDPRELRQEKEALDAMLENFDALDPVGLAVFTRGKMVAFEICTPISRDIYDEHYEKSLLRCKGAAQFVNRETAKLLASRAKYLNREQDMGIPGLRQAKLSYRPCEVLKLFTLSPR